MTQQHTAAERRFIEMWKAGEKSLVIGAELDLPPSTVGDWRKRLGMEARRPSPSKYTDAQIAKIKRLYEVELRTCEDVANEMGRGWSKNMIVGLVRRHGFTKPKPEPVERKKKHPKPAASCAPRPGVTPFDLSRSKSNSTPEQRAEKAAEGRAAIAKVEAANIGSPNARPFLEAKTGCKWPIGAGMSMLYCCNPTVGGTGAAKVYCSGHYRAAVQPNQARRAKSPVSSFTRHDRIATPRPKPANDPFGSTWDDERAVA